MEQETILKEILNALKLHGEHMDKRFDEMDKKFDKRLDDLNSKMDEGFTKVNQRFDRLEKKVEGNRVELTETQETTDFILSKTAQHEKKLRQLSDQHQ
ncbi:hypothetical protein [Oceanobacillus sp. CF4.6]|uniref:hypothetical protein n=1 Tax=Oceanobacillus sp. CF4.6 TaxID=3373080 RepID=UPI003EE6AF5F